MVRIASGPRSRIGREAVLPQGDPARQPRTGSPSRPT
jgi:hypothetical protein